MDSAVWLPRRHEVIVLLCNQEKLSREWLGLSRAFARREPVLCLGPGLEESQEWKPNRSVKQLLAGCPVPPKLLLHPDGSRFLPSQLEKINIHTACFQIDAYAYLHRRLLWSMLFDYVFVFHPGYVDRFVKAGHPRVFLQPHAVEAEPFLRISQQTRTNEVGWVGRLDGSLYAHRRCIISCLAETFRMNDWHRSYRYEEMVEVYANSKIAVNVSRDDYPEDANLRVFEIMAAGALLFTSLPSELEQLGFSSGVHFVGYNCRDELIDRIRYYLEHDADRERIATSGRELVLTQHTYDRRVEEILRILDQDSGELFAPARSWSEDRVRQVYLDFYCAHNLMHCAFEELRHLSAIRPMAAWNSLPLIAGAMRRRLINRATHLTKPWPALFAHKKNK